MTVDEGVDISKAGDRGVLKRILKEGEGSDTPNAGCTVTVHYTGTLLDGTKFDSSKDRNEPFEFQLGKGSVIKAWDIGVATMKKGEVCVLTCAPEYAYGASGSPPKIPPNSTLQFEIEMIDWQVEDLSPGKNKGILRHIIEQGADFDTPNDGSLVTVELEGRLLPSGPVFEQRTVTFPLGEGAASGVCDGVERALEKFRKGERSRITLAPKYAFKSDGKPELGVPADASVEYTARLVDFERAKDAWALDAPEKLARAELYKEKGTNYFKAGKHQLAIKMYKRVVSLLDDMVEDTSVEEESKSKARELLLSSHLNLALVYQKASPPHHFESKEHSSKALGLDPANVKGLFRRGQALLALGDAELALADFRAVTAAEPANKAAASMIAQCQRAVQAQRQRERRLYANMFDKFAKHDTEVERLREKEQQSTTVGEWPAEQRAREPTHFERENPNILLLDKDGTLGNM